MARPGIFLKKVLPYLILLICYLAPRLVELDRFVTPDEPKWLARSANFYQALVKHEWSATLQRSHPGVTVTWAGALAFYRAYPRLVETHPGYFERPQKLVTFLYNNQLEPMDFLVLARQGMVIAGAFVFLAALYILSTLVGVAPALLALCIAAFDPFYLGHSRLLHLDALASSLMLVSFLGWLAWLNTRAKRYLIASALSAGLAWLTKSPSLVLAILTGLAATIYLISEHQRDQNWLHRLRLYGAGWLAWLCLAVLVVLAFWPAMWVDPLGTIAQVVSMVGVYAEGGHDAAVFYNGTIYPGSIPDPSFYLAVFYWRSTPVLLLGSLAVVLALILSWWAPRLGIINHAERRVLLTLLGYALLYGTAISLSAKKFDRYLLPSTLAMDIAVGIAWSGWLRLLARKLVSVPMLQRNLGWMHERMLIACLALIAVSTQAAFSLPHAPYYLDSYNSLAGGAQGAQKAMSIGWGEGLDKAADYLRSQSISSAQLVAWYGTDGFTFYYPGPVLDMDPELTLADLQRSNYVITYISQVQRGLPNAVVLEYLAGLQPVYTVKIGRLEYAWVYAIQRR